MHCSPGDGERINSFALVSYIPDPLGRYLSNLRQQLVPACNALSHVTVLPPRCLADPRKAWDQTLARLGQFSSFDLHLTDIEVFPATQVIYLALGQGYDQLVEIHNALNSDAMAFAEPYEYHPHVTLAQDLTSANLAETLQAARRSWAECPFERSYTVSPLMFVQNALHTPTGRSFWIDLEQHRLNGHPIPDQPVSAHLLA
ncbi:MAG: 2'-5' RNA ligase family protein [Bryobacteraceae bacterium]|nr:2'-5' RNA ligase family protein [Bryobacteraceae bacterium]